MKLRIEVSHERQIVPGNDWSACFDNYEPGCPLGYGSTPALAVGELYDQLDEETPAHTEALRQWLREAAASEQIK